MSDRLDKLAARAYAIQDYEKDLVAQAGAGSGDYGSAGPPYWNREAWDAFHAQYGYYPFGMQNGSQVLPTSFEGCPDWAYALMGLRRPPVTVTPPGI